MFDNWNKPITLNTEKEVLDKLNDLEVNKWLCRGHSKHFKGGLIPLIDRELSHLSRREKLTFERKCIDVYRKTAKSFASQGERDALFDDIAVLIVLRQYGVPTRLLDWSQSPYVAAYFAVEDNDAKNGEIWSFDAPLWGREAEKKQWKILRETTIDGSGNGCMFKGDMTAFKIKNPPNWFACYYYPNEFPRQDAQKGAYTMTARFGCNHAKVIKEFFNDNSRHQVYVVPANLKPALRKYLCEKKEIWRGHLFPDTAGAAENARKISPLCCRLGRKKSCAGMCFRDVVKKKRPT